MWAKLEQRKSAIKMRQSGKSLRQISEELGVAKSSVSTWVRYVPQPSNLTNEFRRSQKLLRIEAQRLRVLERSNNPKGKPAAPPYTGYLLYDNIYDKRDGRRKAILYHTDPKVSPRRITLLYSRYIMSTFMGRILLPEEQVDHVNDNPHDDRIENLQILNHHDNMAKLGKSLGGKLLVDLDCPICGIIFTKEKRQTHFHKGTVRTTCSKSCGYKSLSVDLSKFKHSVVRVYKEYEIPPSSSSGERRVDNSEAL